MVFLVNSLLGWQTAEGAAKFRECTAVAVSVLIISTLFIETSRPFVSIKKSGRRSRLFGKPPLRARRLISAQPFIEPSPLFVNILKNVF